MKKTVTKSQYTIDGTPLADHHPYLGVEISQDMSYINIISKLQNLLRRSLSKVTTQNTRDAVYKGTVHPHLEYASSV